MVLFENKDTRELRDLIYDAEVTAEDLGDSVPLLLSQYAETYKDLEPLKSKKIVARMERIADRVRAVDEEKDIIYRGIVPPDILGFMKIANDTSVKSSSIFKEYSPIKELGDSALRKFQTKMYLPFIIFVIGTFSFNFLVSEFIPIAEGGSIPFSKLSIWVMHHFLAINFIYGAIFAFVFFGIPKKVPLIKKVFDGIEGMLALATIMILYKLKYSSTEIIPVLVERFNLYKIRPKDDDMIGLTRLLYDANFITVPQASQLRNTGSVTANLGKRLERIFKEKKEDVLLLDEVLQEVIKNITIFLIVVPLGLILYVLGNLFMGVMSLV